MQITQKLSIALLFSTLSGCTSYHPNPQATLHDRFTGREDSYGHLLDERRTRREEWRRNHSEPANIRTGNLPSDVRVIDFNTASREIQDACTKIINYPVLQQGPFGDFAYATVVYDINQYGHIINAKLDPYHVRGTDHIKDGAMRGVSNTRYEPPVFEGQRLYCRNIRDTLEWDASSFGITYYATRWRPNHKAENHRCGYPKSRYGFGC